MRKLYLVLLLLVLSWSSGCALWFQRDSPQDNSIDQESGEENSFLQELVSFLGNLSAMPPQQRVAECQRLLRLHEQGAGPGVQIRLALSLMVTQECSDNESKRALVLLDEATEQLDSLQLLDFLAYQRELALRLSQNDKYQQQLINKLAKCRKSHNRAQQKFLDCDKDLQETLKKLEALKAIEKSLNHTEVQ